MRALASSSLLCLCLTTACASPLKPTAVTPAPALTPVPALSRPRSALAARAPRTTRVLFHLAPLANRALPDAETNREDMALLERCAIDPTRDLVSIDGWVDESGEARAEVTGTITLKKVACFAGALGVPVGDGSTSLAFGPFRVSERANGIVVSTAGAIDGPGAPEALARRFDAMIAEDAELVVATSAGDPPFEVIERRRGMHQTYELRIGEEQAARAAAVLAPLLVRAHNPLLETIEVTVAGESLVLRFDASVNLVLALRREVMESFNTPSQSMSPTLLLGDHFFMVKDVPGRAIERGEVIVFEHKEGQRFVKRVIGLPGDHIVTRGDVLTVNGTTVTNTPVGEVVLDGRREGKPIVRSAGYRETLGEHTYTVMRDGEPLDETVDVVVPAGHVFVLGDNRHNSFDSRQFGPVPFTKILGRAAVIYLSLRDTEVRWERFMRPVE